MRSTLFTLTLSLAFIPLSFSNLDIICNTDGDIYLLQVEEDRILKSVNLTHHPAGDIEPRWSPDGQKIALSSGRDGNFEIYIMDLRRGKLKRMTYDPASDRAPAWSPDGRKIAFISQRVPRGIYIMDILTGKTFYLKGTGLANCITWRNRRKILLATTSKVEGSRLYLGDVLTGEIKELAFLAPPPPGVNRISLSPDGGKLVFDSQHQRIRGSNQFDVYLMDLQEGSIGNLTHHPSHDLYPCWTPDSQFIVFSSSREGSLDKSDIYFMTPDGKMRWQLKLEGWNTNPDVFDPRYAYHSVSSLIDLKRLMWGMIKR